MPEKPKSASGGLKPGAGWRRPSPAVHTETLIALVERLESLGDSTVAPPKSPSEPQPGPPETTLRPLDRAEYITLSPGLIHSLAALAKACDNVIAPFDSHLGHNALKGMAQSAAGRVSVGLLWAVFAWFLIDTQIRTPWFEVMDAATWIAKMVILYGMTVWTVMVYNIAVHRLIKPTPRAEAQDVDRSADYLGRAVRLEGRSAFSDAHLVVDIVDGEKIYRAEPLGHRTAVRHAGVG